MIRRSMVQVCCFSLLGACSGALEPGDEAAGDVDDVGVVAQDLIVRPPPLPPAPVPDPDAPMCGGIAAIDCPGIGRCVEDPYDDCDPAEGGADCSGLCVCVPPYLPWLRLLSGAPPGPESFCGSGRYFDRSVEVCACVPETPNPCATVLCASGTVCVAKGAEAVCVWRPVLAE
jgi:hypothetical protein